MLAVCLSPATLSGKTRRRSTPWLFCVLTSFFSSLLVGDSEQWVRGQRSRLGCFPLSAKVFHAGSRAQLPRAPHFQFGPLFSALLSRACLPYQFVRSLDGNISSRSRLSPSAWLGGTHSKCRNVHISVVLCWRCGGGSRTTLPLNGRPRPFLQ